MAKGKVTPTQFSEVIDDIERIREELLIVQNALQKMEGVGPAPPLPKLSKLSKQITPAFRFCLLVTVQMRLSWVVTLSKKYPA